MRVKRISKNVKVDRLTRARELFLGTEQITAHGNKFFVARVEEGKRGEGVWLISEDSTLAKWKPMNKEGRLIK